MSDLVCMEAPCGVSGASAGGEMYLPKDGQFFVRPEHVKSLMEHQFKVVEAKAETTKAEEPKENKKAKKVDA